MTIINQTEALDYLQSGKTIIFPTETSYGLGCDATNQGAVDKIFKIKGRSSDKPLLIVVPTVGMAREYLGWSPLLEKLALNYWSGAVTVVGECRMQNAECRIVNQNNLQSEICNLKLADGVISKESTVAIRVTSNEILRELTIKLGKPVVATSANIADAGDIYDSAELIKMYEGREFQPDAIVSVGILPKNKPTTIVSVVGGVLKVLRQGEVRVESL